MESTQRMLIHIKSLLSQIGVCLDPRNLWTLAAMIVLLLKGTPLPLTELARVLPGRGAEASRIQKLRRWVSNPHITPQAFVPLLMRLLAPWLVRTGRVVLIFDRTDWIKRGTPLNVFVCSLAFFGRSFPVHWILLPTRGCSCLRDQQQVLTPVLEAITAYPLLATLPCTAIADREFGSLLLTQWLKETWHGHSGRRIKQSVLITRSNIPPISIRTVVTHCEQGQYYFVKDIALTDAHHWYANLGVSWRTACEEPLALMTDLSTADLTHNTSRERLCIDTLHRDVKSGGYEIEDSRITDRTRVANLLIPAAFAYSLALIQRSTLNFRYC